MKGIVFTEFLELVEDKFGLEVVDEIIEKSNLESKGAYTAVGTYSYSEMVELLGNLSERVNISIDDLLHVYGKHFFTVLLKSYPGYFDSSANCFDMLESVNNYIHPEVMKLYPDAELPTFETTREGSNVLKMLYKSNRKMANFAKGLVEETIAYYKEGISYTMEDIKGDNSEVLFTLTKN